MKCNIYILHAAKKALPFFISLFFIFWFGDLGLSFYNITLYEGLLFFFFFLMNLYVVDIVVIVTVWGFNVHFGLNLWYSIFSYYN
jgi:hypothetical protein